MPKRKPEFEVESYFCGYLITYPSGRDRLIQSDWDFPSLARDLGWNGKIGRERCDHRGTDGTVACPDCGRTATQFIEAAANYIDKSC
jgi:ribosomal protein S27E